MRYTEIRMQRIAHELLADLDKTRLITCLTTTALKKSRSTSD